MASFGDYFADRDGPLALAQRAADRADENTLHELTLVGLVGMRHSVAVGAGEVAGCLHHLEQAQQRAFIEPGDPVDAEANPLVEVANAGALAPRTVRQLETYVREGGKLLAEPDRERAWATYRDALANLPRVQPRDPAPIEDAVRMAGERKASFQAASDSRGGFTPSGMARPAPPPPPGVLSSSRRSSRSSMAKPGAGCITVVKPSCS